MSRAVLRCQACRYSLLDAFTSLAGVSLSSQRIHCLPTTPAPPLSRRIHSTARRFQSIQAKKASSDTNDEAQPSTASEAPHTEAQPIPWYLEIDNPEPPGPTLSSPILARQQIPPLPSNPPSVLLPLLSHLSISIGLDDLTLIDLRTLSPPPALGANLLMIIGTARSVKHLNVSADRFCRWLRTNYKLRPYADGLLGRNELKLKLRRKERRLKLERAAGRQSDENVDDGITTGWVCVNVGPVDHVVVPAGSSVGDVVQEAPLTEEDIDDGEEYVNPEEPEVDEVEVFVKPTPDHDVDPAYVGFGSRATSQRIVVQMFTEEKRAEMNLEELWNARNMRRIIKEEKADARAEYARKQKEVQERERKKAGAKAKAVQEGGQYVEEMLQKLEDLSVEEKEELRRRIEALRLEEGEEGGEKMKEDPKWSPIFNVKS